MFYVQINQTLLLCMHLSALPPDGPYIESYDGPYVERRVAELKKVTSRMNNSVCLICIYYIYLRIKNNIKMKKQRLRIKRQRLANDIKTDRKTVNIKKS